MRSMRLRCAMIGLVFLVSGCTLDRPKATTARKAIDSSAHTGGSISVAITEPDGIDPTNAHEPSNMLVASTMCDTLITLDPVTAEPKPALAESWSISGGGRKLIIKLRKDIRFSDGSELTADDVVFTLTRLADQRFASRSARVIDAISGFEFVHGDATTDDDRFRENLVGIRAIENRAVEITLDERLSEFFLALTHPATSIVPRSAVEADAAGFDKNPICAGPYRLLEPWSPGSPVQLVRSPSYHGLNQAFTRGGRGYADRITFLPFADREAAFQAVAQRDADIAQVPEGSLTDARNRGVEIIDAPTPRIEFIGLPTSVPPFDDRKVRIALSQAIDRKAIAESIYQSGRAPAEGLLPLTMRKGKDPCASNVPPSSDTDAAKATLASSGVDLTTKSGHLYVSDDFSNKAVADAVAARWNEVFGFKVDVIAMSWERFLASGISPRGFDGAFRAGWYPAYPSIDTLLVPLFHAESIGRDNLTRFSSRDFNEAVAAARRAVDPTDRSSDYMRAAALVCDQMPVIPLFFESRAYTFRSDRLGSASKEVLSTYSAEPVLRELFAK